MSEEDAGSEESLAESADPYREFTELLSQHRPKIMLYLLSLVHHMADAEDLCQRSSVVMWQKFSQYRRDRSFLAWACGIAKLETMNHLRARAADRHAFQSDVVDLLAMSVESLEDSSDQPRLAALRRCLQDLPQAEQTFLTRIYWEGSSFEAIAANLGCSPRTFYNRMYLLRRRLLLCVARRLRTEDLE